MKILIKIFLILIIIVFIIGIGVLGYIGFIPSISKMLGSDKPRNLGVTFTNKDAEISYVKNGVESLTLPITEAIEDSIKYEGKKSAEFELTQSELTALINSNKWKYYPISQVQIKLNKDGTGEASGILHIDRVLPFIGLTHSTEEVEDAMQKYKISGNPPFYLKGRVSVVNNEVTMVPDKIEIGRISIPSSIVNDNIDALEEFAEQRIAKVPNLDVQLLSHENGTLMFKGTMPEKEYTAKAN